MIVENHDENSEWDSFSFGLISLNSKETIKIFYRSLDISIITT